MRSPALVRGSSRLSLTGVVYVTEEGNPDMTQSLADFAAPAPDETIQLVAGQMRERNIEVVVVDDGAAARQVALERSLLR